MLVIWPVTVSTSMSVVEPSSCSSVTPYRSPVGSWSSSHLMTRPGAAAWTAIAVASSRVSGEEADASVGDVVAAPGSARPPCPSGVAAAGVTPGRYDELAPAEEPRVYAPNPTPLATVTPRASPMTRRAEALGACMGLVLPGQGAGSG